MTLPQFLMIATAPADLIGLALLLLGWFGIGWLIENPPRRHPSVSELMKHYRREWMRHFVTRDPRIFDGNVLSNLREGTAFFASACMIAIGGGVALIGNADRMRVLARDFDLEQVVAASAEAKLLLTLLLVIHAFLNFVWSNRLFGYCAILMAAVPDASDDPVAYARADQAADLNIIAGRKFNAGLRSVYFALGSLGWLGGGWGLCIGATLVSWLTWRREFASNSRRIILRALPPEHLGGAAVPPTATGQRSPPPPP
ncbi:MAG: DUF599 domain-containing protein [Paracoccus sp. (in: a-proteobacteria)]|nr:DUF599 domain-containing protein [Paracoccus sp. (in: a-proteobacteria)]